MERKQFSEDHLRRLELWVGFFKFIVGTVILGLVSLFLNHQYQNNQLDLEREKSSHAIALQDKKAEFEYLSKFMTHAMNEDLEVRIRLADYMQSAALSENIKEIWRRYHEVLIKQQTETLAKRENLKKKEDELAKQLSSIKDDSEVHRNRQIQQINEVRKEIYYLQDQLDRRKYGSFKENYVDVYDIFRKAQAASNDGNYSEALTLLKNGLTSDSSSLEYFLLSEIASTYRAMRDFKSAEMYAKRAAFLEPKDAEALLTLAIMQKNNHQIEPAISTLQEAEEISQGERRLNIQLVIAGYLIHAGKRSQGMEKFKLIQTEVEASAALVTNLAWFRAVAGPEEEFYKTFERALSLDRDGRVFHWVDMEVDLDRYREETHFIELVERFKRK